MTIPLAAVQAMEAENNRFMIVAWSGSHIFAIVDKPRKMNAIPAFKGSLRDCQTFIATKAAEALLRALRDFVCEPTDDGMDDIHKIAHHSIRNYLMSLAGPGGEG